MDNKVLFAKNLKSARKKAGMSQVQLAEKLSYTGKSISKWESGMAFPPTEILPAIAATLNTDINSLFDFREDASYFLGVDGGGTKTKFLLTDSDGHTLRELTLGCCNPTSIGVSSAGELFYKGIKGICQNIPLGRVSVFIGAAGCGIEQNQKEIYSFLSKLNLSSLKIGSDAENIISAGLKGENGVIAIMGTGSAVFSCISEKRCQIGGYGHFIGDAFSGSELGRACLEAVFGHLDGSGEKTTLTKAVTAEIGNDIPKILSQMYTKGKAYMAALAHYVFSAAENGDAVAKKIININTEKLARQLSAALSLLPADKKYPVILAGGITNFKDKFIDNLKEKITATNLSEIKILPDEPVVGAVLLARKEQNNA